jgi:hypothetical protein
MVWALENPNAGIVEADEMDFRRCLEIQMPYLGPVKGFYTDWTPLRTGRACSRKTSTSLAVRSLAVQERAGAVQLANPRGLPSTCGMILRMKFGAFMPFSTVS